MNEKFVFDYIHCLRPLEGLAIDIGANHGHYTTMLAEKFTRVHAFEPHPDNIKTLRERVGENYNVTIVEKAISSQTGEGWLYTAINPGGHSISEPLALAHTWGHHEDCRIPVQTITIDDYVAANGPPSFLKVDIEGAEDFIFEGAINTLRRYHPEILLEVHQFVDTGRLFRFFRDLGYRWFNASLVEVEMISNDEHYLLRSAD